MTALQYLLFSWRRAGGFLLLTPSAHPQEFIEKHNIHIVAHGWEVARAHTHTRTHAHTHTRTRTHAYTGVQHAHARKRTQHTRHTRHTQHTQQRGPDVECNHPYSPQHPSWGIAAVRSSQPHLRKAFEKRRDRLLRFSLPPPPPPKKHIHPSPQECRGRWASRARSRAPRGSRRQARTLKSPPFCAFIR